MSAAALGIFVLLEVIAAGVLCIVLGWSWQDALEAFVVTNSAIGLSLGSCGAVLAWHRPRNPIGWLFVAGGVAQATSALAAPLGAVLHQAAAPIAVQRLLITIFSWSWPWAIGLVLPLALLLFPDGRPVSRGWRWVVIAVIITAPLFPLEMGTFPGPTEPGYPTGYLTIPFYDLLQPLWTATELRTTLAMFLGLTAVVVRYRRGSDVERRQLLWLVLAVLVALIVLLPWGLVANTPVEVLFAIPLIPIAVTVAIVRVQLLDIRLVVSRLLAWLILLLAVIVAYTGLAALVARFATPRLAGSAMITALLVLLAAPLLPRLQRLVDGAVYGERGDPASVVSRLGEQLASPDAGLQGVVTTVRSALRLPYLAIERDNKILASDGQPPERIHRWPLTRGGKSEGQLTIGLRPGERELAAADRRALAMLADPVAVAVHSTVVSEELQASRERIVAAREEERRKLRRELHDGLGPTLTGIAFAADAAANTIDDDPERSQELLTTLRRDTRAALADVRRLVDNLRPPALDELGLVGALRQRADQLSWRADGASVKVRLDVPDEVPALPAAIEVATYRIATEALTNVVRHSAGDGRTGPAPMRRATGGVDHRQRTSQWPLGAGRRAARDAGAGGGARRLVPGRTDTGRRPGGGLISLDSSDDVMSDIRVVLADDHPVVRAGLAALLGSMAGIEVVGVAADGHEAVREVVLQRPDVAMLDLQMPGQDGFAATRQITRAAPDVAVLVLTMFDDDDSVFTAMRAGARGYVVKGAEQEEIGRAIRAVASGEAIFGPGVAQRVLRFFATPAPAANPFPELTTREREILDLLAAAMPNSMIATRLGLSPKTVANHLSSIFTKLQVADRAQAILRARDAGLGVRQDGS